MFVLGICDFLFKKKKYVKLYEYKKMLLYVLNRFVIVWLNESLNLY